MFDYWQTRAKDFGLDGIYFVAVNQYKLPEKDILNCFDAVMLFQPFVAAFNFKHTNMSLSRKLLLKLERKLPQSFKKSLKSFNGFIKRKQANSTTIYDYDEVWEKIISVDHDISLPVFSGAFVDWDNTPRYGERATIFKGANPDKFEFWLSQLIKKVKQKTQEEQFIFINAWNEWAESAYLEPDDQYGLKYLEAIRNILQLENK